MIEDAPAEADLAALVQCLVAYNVERVGSFDNRPLAILLRDAHGTVVGGLSGRTFWGWLYVAILVVPEEMRGAGRGKGLLMEAEAEARRRGCRAAFLDTFSFQTLGFYQRAGYQVFGTLEDFPPPHRRYFLTKRLDDDATYHGTATQEVTSDE